MVEKIKNQHPPKPFSESSFVESNPGAIKNSIISQVHYYFSKENLCKDIYLRCNMNDEGWVSIPFICSFNRMKSFDQNTVVSAIKSSSDQIEINSELNNIRIKSNDDRKLWILSEEIKNGFLSARSLDSSKSSQDPEGWETVISKNHRNSNKISPNTGKPITTSNDEEMFVFSDDSEEQDFFSKERRNFENSVYNHQEEQGNQVDEEDYSYYSTDEEINYSGEEEDYDLTIDDQDELMKKLIIVTPSPYKKNKINSRKYMSNEIASIINDGLYFYEQDLKRKKQIFKPTNFSTLIIDEKKTINNNDTTSSTTIPTISNTIIINNNNIPRSKNDKPSMAQLLKDHHQIDITTNDVNNKAPTRLYSPKPKNSQRNNNNQQRNKNTAIGWVVSSGSNTSSPSTTPRGTPITSSVSSSFNDLKVGSVEEGLPYFQHPSYELLEDNGFVQHKYEKYMNKCLKERKRLGIGKSTEMNTLFRFWSHFLRTHFIQKIYQEFITISLEDAKQGANYGMECVFRFYSYGLEKKFKPELFADFQKHTVSDYKSGSIYALEKFWAFLKYRKDQTPLELIPELKEILSKFKTIDDFRKSSLSSSPSPSLSNKQNNNNNYNSNHNSHHHHNSTKKPQQSSYQTNTSSSMKPTKSNSFSSTSSKMMSTNKNGFM